MKSKISAFKKTRSTYVLLFASFLMILWSAIIISISYSSTGQITTKQYPEIDYLAKKHMNYEQLSAFFKELSNKKTAIYAFEILSKAPMPYGIDMHLLAHSIGDVLYRQEGINGMRYCTDNFRNACSHSLVINLFYEKGEAGLADISEACKKAPGEGGYSMCYHGLGHGVFAYSGYDFPKTTELCKKTATENAGDEYKECMGGALMEQVNGGDHDKASWQKQRLINFHQDQPLYPCMSDLFSDPESRQICLVYLTPYLWELAGRNSENVSDEVIIRSFEYCNDISLNDPKNRDACFGGFGKEFLSMAKGKDIRNIDKLTDDEMKRIYRWCSLTPHKDGQKSCILYAQGSMFWSGANDKKLVEHFCSLAPQEEAKMDCFEGLIHTVKNSDKKEQSYLTEFCNEIPSSVQAQCKRQLLQ